MARIGAGGDNIEDTSDTETEQDDSTDGDDSLGDDPTDVPARGGGPTPEPEPDPEPEPEPDPTDQPARGRDRDSGSGRGSGGTGDVGETEPEPDPTDQPARGRDPDSGAGRGSGGAGDVGESQPEDDPTDQPARGADPDSGDGMGSGDPDPEPDPTPEPDQPTRGGGTTPPTEPEDVTETETVTPEDFQETETIDVTDIAEGDFATGQGIETQDAPGPMATGEISGDELSVAETERLFEQATGEELESAGQLEDVSFRRVGDTVAVFGAEQADQAATAFAAERFESNVAEQEGIDPSDIAIERRDGELVAAPTEEYLTEQAATQLSGEEGVVGVETGDGEVTATFEPTQDELAQEFETVPGVEQVYQRGSGDDGAVTAVVGLTEEQIENIELSATRQMDEQVGENIRDVSAAREEVQRERTREEFGDVPITIPDEVTIGEEYEGPTGPTAPPGARGGRMGEQTFDLPRGGERVENVLSDLSEGFSKTIREATEEGAFFGESATAELLEATGRDELAQNIEDAGRDFLRGAGEIANVPEVAVGAKEAGEFVGFGAGEIATGEGSEFAEASAEAATERAQALAEFAEENPAEFGGTLAGSLIGSTAIMGAAGRVGTRTGLASRAAIQPGEEALGFGGNIATRAIASERTAERLFPDNEPLIFSEEAAIRGARSVSERARRTGEILTGDRPLPQTPFSRELTELGRPGGSRGIIGDIGPTGMGGDLTTRIEGPRAEAGVQQEAGAVGAPSEPLGGATEDILDRLYPTETETETGPGQSFRERTRSVVEEFAEDEAATAQLLSRTESRQRGVTESEVERQEDRVSDNLYQQAIDRQVRAETEALEGTIESPETRFETRAERRRAATEPDVRTETETELESRTETRFRTEPGLGIDTRQDAFTDVFGDVDTRTGLDVNTELATELGTEFETETETELEQELETELEPELELEPEAEAETEFETEFEAEVEPETEIEAEAEPEIEEQQDLEEELLLGLEDIEERFGTGIASVEDLLEDN